MSHFVARDYTCMIVVILEPVRKMIFHKMSFQKKFFEPMKFVIIINFDVNLVFIRDE